MNKYIDIRNFSYNQEEKLMLDNLIDLLNKGKVFSISYPNSNIVEQKIAKVLTQDILDFYKVQKVELKENELLDFNDNIDEIRIITINDKKYVMVIDYLQEYDSDSSLEIETYSIRFIDYMNFIKIFDSLIDKIYDINS